VSNKTRVCVISPEIVGPYANGGIGTHCYYLSAFLNRLPEHEVTFLYTGKIERRTEPYWRDWFGNNLGVEFVWLAPPASLDAAPPPLRSSYVHIARNVYQWLRRHSFDVCHFQEMLANGFRCFQAKRLNLAFRETLLTCTVHSSWEWICQAMQTLPQAGGEELQTKFMERYCIEHCDLLISPSEYMLQWLQQNRVQTPARTQVLPYLFDPKLPPVGFRPAAHKIIFFGRLEVRKGLLLFLEALLLLDGQGAFAGHPLEVIFLGKSGYTPDGGGSQTIEKLRPRFSRSVRLKTISDLGHRQAMDFLARHNDALVVCPSLVDNSPYAVIESLQLRLNIIAAHCGGIPELFADADRLFKPVPEALAAKIQAGLKNQLPPPAKRYDLERTNRLWGEFCQELVPTLRQPVALASGNTAPSIRIFLAGGAQEQSLTRALQSVEAQTLKGYSLTVILAPGSGHRPLSQELQQQCQQRGWEVKEALSASSMCSDFCLFISAGCFPKPEMLERLVQSLSVSGLEALTCCAETVSHDGEQPAFVYEPLGACLEGGIFSNLFGAGCVLLRTGADVPTWPSPGRLLQSAGIWAFLAEISVAGRDWDVLPEILLRLEGDKAGLLGTALDYGSYIDLLESYCRNSPMWLRYLLLNAVASARGNTGPSWQRHTQAHESEPKPILFKIKRETRRILNQCRSLYRGV
jgi:glycosyltransferase involved in cell wall biosynthesis